MDKTSEKEIETNKSFWSFIKPFIKIKAIIKRILLAMT